MLKLGSISFAFPFPSAIGVKLIQEILPICLKRIQELKVKDGNEPLKNTKAIISRLKIKELKLQIEKPSDLGLIMSLNYNIHTHTYICAFMQFVCEFSALNPNVYGFLSA